MLKGPNVLKIRNVLTTFSGESASIVSGQMTYVQEGDLINITCIVEGGTRTEPPDQIFWYHKGEVYFLTLYV